MLQTAQIRDIDLRTELPEGTYSDRELYLMRQERYALMHELYAIEDQCMDLLRPRLTDSR